MTNLEAVRLAAQYLKLDRTLLSGEDIIAICRALVERAETRDAVIEDCAKRFEGGFTVLKGDVAALAAATLRGMKSRATDMSKPEQFATRSGR